MVNIKQLECRDIKVENLFLSRAGELKLGDFGLAVNVALEQAITRVGTLDYMSPEVQSVPSDPVLCSATYDCVGAGKANESTLHAANLGKCHLHRASSLMSMIMDISAYAKSHWHWHCRPSLKAVCQNKVSNNFVLTKTWSTC